MTKLHHLEVTIRLSKGHAESCCHHPERVTNCRIARVFTLNFPLKTNIMTLKIDGWKMNFSYQNWLALAELPGYIYTFLPFWGELTRKLPIYRGPHVPPFGNERLFHWPLPEARASPFQCTFHPSNSSIHHLPKAPRSVCPELWKPAGSHLLYIVTEKNTHALDGRNPANQLRSVVNPIIYRVFYVVQDFFSINSMTSYLTHMTNLCILDAFCLTLWNRMRM